MKPSAFDYQAPTTVAEAVQLLADLGDEAKVLAGGQSLIPMLALRLAAPEHLIDIGRIAELQGIERRNGQLRIGAGTSEAAVGVDPDVAAGVPLLAQATPMIGHFQIRNRGTLGGSVAHADPAAEYPAIALALDAEMEVVSSRGRRAIAGPDYFLGFWTTAMEPDELLVAVTFPTWSGRCGFAVEEFTRRHGDFAIAGACVGVELDGNDRVTRSAIGLIGLGSTPERPKAAEASVLGVDVADVVADDLGRLALSGLDAIPSDLRGSAKYRERVGAATVARAWTAAVVEARRD